ncbi:MAG: hypothetical protein GY865_02145 [candidate division Zixibacteria bacterium]|nr:hypothetical protein [candidate division Zixibacteria bacterium]
MIISIDKKVQSFLIVLLLFSVSPTFAQGDYLKKGTNGLAFGADFSTNSENSILSGKISYSPSGVFDFGIIGGYFTAADIDENRIFMGGLLLSYHIYKQKPHKFPLSMSLNLTYHRDAYKGDNLTLRNWEKNGDYLNLDIKLFSNINVTSKTTIQPNGSISFIAGSIGIRDSYNNFTTQDRSVIAFNLGTSIFLNASDRMVLRIDPRVRLDKYNTTLSISVGVILPKYKKKSSEQKTNRRPRWPGRRF